jgi:hypothetical protein
MARRRAIAANRIGLIAAWEAQAPRSDGNDLLVAACRARYFSDKGVKAMMSAVIGGAE